MSQSSGLGSRRAARMAAWICALAPLLTACDGPAVAPAPPPPPEVGVIQVTPRTQPLTFEVIGDIRAYQEVELRPRVSGVVEKPVKTRTQAANKAIFFIFIYKLRLGILSRQ